jgi:uncharacterized membrane protein YfcA
MTSFTKFYPLMLAMIFGSMIAGSTPLGGGVVAFPVTVLILNFTPRQGRDFSLLIQSVGMTAASFLIFSEKKNLWTGCGVLMAIFCFFSCIGLVIGFTIESKLSPFLVNVFYTTAVACFAIVLVGIRNPRSGERPEQDTHHDRSCTEQSKDSEDKIEVGESECKDLANQVVGSRTKSIARKVKPTSSCSPFTIWIGVAFSAIIGGILSSQIGTGADIAWYACGCFFNSAGYSGLLLNGDTPSSCTKTTRRLSENSLTAISVIVMACTSVNGSILRVTNQNPAFAVDRDVYEALLACSFIVVFGAPLGATFLTPSHQKRLNQVFYIFALLQLILFGVIKIKNNAFAWTGVAISLTVASLISFKIRISS